MTRQELMTIMSDSAKEVDRECPFPDEAEIEKMIADEPTLGKWLDRVAEQLTRVQ